ncbi:nucleolar MIF4G domain-containing protein 1 [Marchantia polymorpha subsp. ruderalis]|uniref:MI domain-containing protein n=2 Tax=Marchantia polymorpha TaxID=3197 RepID=A0AAF6BR60_MARPO|nr:hypothetical protein MARPO_0135s0015 [Marchantia polymorpha]PTQ29730.1 hypothetical protein MARPO_0135s0015 [Marchantia polymorpha]BBN14494.1 hypothetical protein Mp_6g12210 [Marchantia polymorpha subsp. ruderalis]BBN14495.1 hypothetical protein Mp_6g12210 [Marchantia polymorpha subsp. ruderalis]|eukprot:PTQ29729.1 hypothetical protein MARPO_0135s0015 [Marchantia polymorpha]
MVKNMKAPVAVPAVKRKLKDADRTAKRKRKRKSAGTATDVKKVETSVEEEASEEEEVMVQKDESDTDDDEEHKVEENVVTTATTENSAAVKYVPPHLRQKQSAVSEDTVRLQRRIRGLLNRLSEANVESITSDVSTIFQANGRHMVTEILCNEIVGACIEGPRGNDQYAAVFAAFVAGMAASVGIDFGAKFVAALAKALEDQYVKEDNLAVRNLTMLLSHLYVFRLLPCELLYELLGVLCKRFQELDVATILTILQSCGIGLRGDDPAAMKDFILSIQQRTADVKSQLAKATENSSGGLSKRVQFMLDTICEIKNNKKQSKELVPHARLKKWLQKLSVEDVQLRAVTWVKLIDTAQKGQWWLPTAADAEHASEVRGEMLGAMDAGALETDKMLQLAASQRMNTDARRAVFCMVMSGEDYLDAFEKILRLKLPGTQDREVLRVIVECCLQEKVFNKYYALLAAKICQHDKNHKFTMQYCLWDHFKQLDSMELRRSANLARFLGHLISSGSLSLSVLKAVDFADPRVMTPKVVMHFRIFLESLLTEYTDEKVWNSFSRIAPSPKFQELRDGLVLFFHQYMKSARVQEKEGSAGLLALRLKLAKKALKNVAGVLLK